MKIIRLYLQSLLVLCLLSSCETWFDVTADNKVVEEELFATPEGYRIALNGIYKELSSPTLYAKELSWGLTSVLGMNYARETFLSSYRTIVSLDFEAAPSIAYFESVWQAAYRVIANCNNLLAYAEKSTNADFKRGEEERRLIIAEARGIRGFMHFELLRLFVPAAKTGYTGNAIPYVTQYPDPKPQMKKMETVFEDIIKDLEYCEDELKQFDTRDNESGMENLFNIQTGNADLFYAYRGTRLNHCAAAALLARVYLWKGNEEKAYEKAKLVYDYAKEKGWFRFREVTSRNRKHNEDIIFAISNNNLYDDYSVFIQSLNHDGIPLMRGVEKLFGYDLDDYRLNVLITSGDVDKKSIFWEEPKSSDRNPTQSSLIPVIRLSEIYYILCECLRYSDLEGAVRLLNEFRLARGCKTEVHPVDADELLDDIVEDATREFLVEGQSFFLYKRLGRKIPYGQYGTIDMSDNWVLPYPVSEFIN